jgi:speckle-type POZ protein
LETNGLLHLLGSDISKMFDDENLADFKLKTNDNEVLNAHKFILAARSPVFYGMMTQEMKEAKEGIADVPDFDSKIMREVLRFIYCNEVEDLNEVAGDLIVAADKYQIDKLVEICIQNIIESLSTENVLQYLVLSQRVNNAVKLFEACFGLSAWYVCSFFSR